MPTPASSFWGRFRRLSPDYHRPVVETGVRDQLARLGQASVESLRLSILASPANEDPLRLLRHGFKVYSQFDEDGILDEIFSRIGVGDRYFVEFGVGTGSENNTLYRLASGWSGVWIEGSPTSMATIQETFRGLIDAGRLLAKSAFITPANIQALFSEAGVPKEFDLLSIDIDGNDYWVWQALAKFRPRVVVIEYNASFGPSLSWSVPMVPDRSWDGTRNFGASLKALELLGRAGGYTLVGCGIAGANAFFVRTDLVGDKFAKLSNSESHYEPPRYYMTMSPGHPFGPGEVAAILAGPPKPNSDGPV